MRGRPTGRRVASGPSFFADMVTIPTHRRSPSSRHRAIIDPAGSFCKANAVIPDKAWLNGFLYGVLFSVASPARQYRGPLRVHIERNDLNSANSAYSAVQFNRGVRGVTRKGAPVAVTTSGLACGLPTHKRAACGYDRLPSRPFQRLITMFINLVRLGRRRQGSSKGVVPQFLAEPRFSLP